MRRRDQIDIFSEVNTLSLLKSLATGFIPLLAYIVAELVFGETIGLFVGLGIGILEFIINFLKEKKADLFVAADSLLLAAMGLLSLLLRNQIFFRMKPAIMEGFMAIAMTFLLLLPPKALQEYMSHQIKGIVLDEAGLPALRRSLSLMVAVFALHAGLTAWAALAASTALWGFVSGGLLYIMLGIALAGQWITLRRQRKNAPQPVPFAWCLLMFDGTGGLYAGKIPGNENQWDSPARGKAAGEAGLEASLGQTLARLGIKAAGADCPFSIRPAFILDASGKILPISASPEPGAEVVLTAVLPLQAFPRGIDPTERRLWPLPDLLALVSTGKLAASFERELLALSYLGNPLRGDAGAGIVSDNNDAHI